MDKELHPIDQILEERCPKLIKRKILWSLIKPIVFKVFKLFTNSKTANIIILTHEMLERSTSVKAGLFIGCQTICYDHFPPLY